jgi:C-terminal processing protease CtpA/Prc
MLLDALVSANQQGALLTDTLPICTLSLIRTPAPSAYTKTEMLLVDEFSTSAADSMASMIQDSGRAVLLGMRTDGAGGSTTSFDAGPYTEGITGMTLSLMTRQRGRAQTGYPFTDYVENVGVWPEIPVDYMTKDNLLQNGAPFVSAFLQHMAAEIRARK